MKITAALVIAVLFTSHLFAQQMAGMTTMDKENQKFITAHGASINTIGHFKENWESGSGGYIGYGVIYPNQFALLFQTGYIDYKNNKKSGYSGDPSFSMLPIMVGGRYYILPDRFRLFLLANGGINFVSQKYTVADSTVDESRNHFHFQVGAGFSIILIDQVEIEITAKYNSHLLDPSDPYNITGMEYAVGLNWRLSGY
jgi:hypothetical protein